MDNHSKVTDGLLAPCAEFEKLSAEGDNRIDRHGKNQHGNARKLPVPVKHYKNKTHNCEKIAEKARHGTRQGASEKINIVNQTGNKHPGSIFYKKSQVQILEMKIHIPAHVRYNPLSDKGHKITLPIHGHTLDEVQNNDYARENHEFHDIFF